MSEVSEVPNESWDTWRSFFQMRRQLDRVLEKQLQRDADISAADYEILLTLFEAPDRQRRAHELGEILGWEKSRVSHQVSRMEKRGLVEKRLCDFDARGIWVTLTADGRRAVLGASRDHTKAIREYFFDVLSAEELASLKSMSMRVLEAIEPAACDILDEDEASEAHKAS